MNVIKLSSTLVIAGMLTACAQQEEPMTMVGMEPVFDKYGGGSCEEGYVYIPGTATTPPVCEPEECEESSTVGAAAIPCPPPHSRSDDDDGRTASGRRPVGTAAGGP